MVFFSRTTSKKLNCTDINPALCTNRAGNNAKQMSFPHTACVDTEGRKPIPCVLVLPQRNVKKIIYNIVINDIVLCVPACLHMCT